MALAMIGTIASGAQKKAPAPLGNVLYIGDSITHGFQTASYRWELHKIFVDNGIEYDEIGIETGNRKNTVAPNTGYIGVSFKNVHAAMSGERAYEVSNRKHPGGNRLDNSSVFHWLGFDKDNEGNEVTPIDKRKLALTPDTCFILLGTNDMLSDYGPEGGIGKGANGSKAEKDLLDKKRGDMNVIVSALREKNPSVKIVVLTVPTWVKRDSNSTEKDFKTVIKNYNKKLASVFKKETVVDINQGLVDICETELPLMGVKNFFDAGDKLHPSQQGDLIMAGQVARKLGYAGRTAGAPRKAADAFDSQAADMLGRASVKEKVEAAGSGLKLPAGANMESPWPEGAETMEGFTAELQMTVGNGPTGGWEKEGNVIVSLGNGAHSGQLKLAEGYILWHNGAVLYPVNMSGKKLEPIRVAWVPGSATQNVKKGFYVWMGDMLIGEALPDDSAKFNGIGIRNVSEHDETVTRISAMPGVFAPDTKRYVKEAASVLYDKP